MGRSNFLANPVPKCLPSYGRTFTDMYLRWFQLAHHHDAPSWRLKETPLYLSLEFLNLSQNSTCFTYSFRVTEYRQWMSDWEESTVAHLNGKWKICWVWRDTENCYAFKICKSDLRTPLPLPLGSFTTLKS